MRPAYGKGVINMKIKKNIGEIIFDSSNIVFLSLLSLLCIYPMLYVLFASISDGSMLLTHTGLLLAPLGFSTSAYKAVFQNSMIITGYMNTLFVVIVGVCLNLLMTSLAAYVLSRKGVYFNKAIIKLIIFTMVFSGGLIPLYLTVKELGLFNNLFSLILPNVIVTYNMIILRTSFATIPDSMEESARIDGANDFVILFRIIIPLSTSALAVMVLYYGVMHWNAWFQAMLYIRQRTLFPLQLVLREILLVNSTDSMSGGSGNSDASSITESIKYATIVVATLPILLIYPFLQKYFVKGVMIGAVKG